MDTNRFVITDRMWRFMEPHCLGKASDPARTGSQWRDLPPAFGKWNTVFKRFREWVKRDVFIACLRL